MSAGELESKKRTQTTKFHFKLLNHLQINSSSNFQFILFRKPHIEKND